jgi:hypothetical protein
VTEQAVREVFLKNYNGDNLDEALVATIEEVILTLIRECAEKPESLPEIIKTIAIGKSRIVLFAGMKDDTRPLVPISYLTFFDQVRKAMVDAVRYAHDNYETLNQWFRERFSTEHLSLILKEMTFSIEKATERPANVRGFNSEEIQLYEDFFNTMIVGIIGEDRFLKFAKGYNGLINTLRQCQIEGQALIGKTGTKES